MANKMILLSVPLEKLDLISEIMKDKTSKERFYSRTQFINKAIDEKITHMQRIKQC